MIKIPGYEYLNLGTWTLAGFSSLPSKRTHSYRQFTLYDIIPILANFCTPLSLACISLDPRFLVLYYGFYFITFYFKSLPEDMFIDFRQRGRGWGGRERERERETGKHWNIDRLPPVWALTGDQTHNLGMCPDRGSNPQVFGVRDNASTN